MARQAGAASELKFNVFNTGKSAIDDISAGVLCTSDITGDTDNDKKVQIFRSNCNIDAATDVDSISVFVATGPDAAGAGCKSYAGFETSVTTGNIGSEAAYGFKSNLTNGDNAFGGTRYNFYAEGSAPNYFQGITEHVSGVRVTGGTPAGIQDGLIKAAGDGNIRIIREGENGFSVGSTSCASLNRYFSVNGTPTTPGGSVYALNSRTTTPDGFTGNIYGGSFYHTLTGGGTVNVPIHRAMEVFRDYTDWTAADTVTDTYGIYINNNLSPSGAQYDNLKNTYGVWSNIPTQGNRNNYNFYAAGEAPNFFKGNAIFGADPISPVGGTVGLKIVGGDNPRIYCVNTTASNSSIFACSASTGGAVMQFRVSDGAGGVTNCGNIQVTAAGGVNLVDNSDYRLKSNIQSLSSAVDTIKALKPCTYTRNNVDGVVGFIAHEVQEVIPSGCFGEKDSEDGIQSLRLDAILSVTVKALQEALDKIETLETRLSDAGIA